MENLNMSEVIPKQELKTSKLSIIAFLILIFSYMLIGIGILIREKTYFIGAIAPLVLIVCNISSFGMSIIDLTKKDRKKILSIITLVLNCLYFLLFIGAIVVMTLYLGSK